MFMQDSSESSIWRSLAVAFGDGLAFGAGMKLSQHTVRPVSSSAQADIRQLAARLAQLEEQIKRVPVPMAAVPSFDQKVLEAIVNAVEARLQEYSGQAERRLADVEARLAVELQSLDQQDQSVARRVAEDVAALRDEMLALNRGMAETATRLIAEQVAARTAPLNGLEERIADLIRSRLKPVESLDERIAEQVKAQLAAEQTSLEQRVEQAVALQMESAQQSLRELLGAIAKLCQEAAVRMEPSAVAPADPPPPAESASPDAEDNAVPGFAQAQKPGRLWRVPLVSSMVVAVGGFLLMHLH
jgi:hypothetical protein